MKLFRGHTGTNKKFVAIVEGRMVRFGDKQYEDYTMHQDPARKQQYISRHKTRENWHKNGIATADQILGEATLY